MTTINNENFGTPVAVAFRPIQTDEGDIIEVGAVPDERDGKVRILIRNNDSEQHYLWFMNLTNWQATELTEKITLASQVAFHTSDFADLF